jgi:hypothetical protein
MAKKIKDPIACLQKLGSNQRDIVANLKKHKIQGYKNNRKLCPLARYLCQETFAKYNPQVTKENVFLDKGEGEFANYDLPRAFRNFIESFDGDKYPELVDIYGMLKREL